MSVLDSSVVVELVLGREPAPQVSSALDGGVVAPDVLVFEVFSVLRRHSLRRGADRDGLRRALDLLVRLPVDLTPSADLVLSAWDLRERIAAGDALFVALARHLSVPLLTKDARLARAADEHVEVVHVV